MPQSLSNVLLHLVFSTKGRTPWIDPEIRAELYPYIGATLRGHDCPVLQIGGIEDHVHILARLSRSMTIAQLVQKAKTSSSKWMKAKVPGFAWQAGYGAFSVSPNDVQAVVKYIQDQEQHHAKFSFQDELRRLLREAGIEPDERYLWD